MPASVELYVEDLRAPSPSLMAGSGGFFGARDNTITCGWSQDGLKQFPLIKSSIDRVEFATGPDLTPTVSVTASFRRKQLTAAESRKCREAQLSDSGWPTFTLRTRTYHLDFLFNGRDFRPTAASRPAARVFADR